jgi:hypothetical protein
VGIAEDTTGSHWIASTAQANPANPVAALRLGGNDNARFLQRATPVQPGLFAAEISFVLR